MTARKMARVSVRGGCWTHSERYSESAMSANWERVNTNALVGMRFARRCS